MFVLSFILLEENINSDLMNNQICKNEDLCEVSMTSEKDKILEFKQYMKSDKMPYIIYTDIESLIRKIDGCGNNPEKSSTMKTGGTIP